MRAVKREPTAIACLLALAALSFAQAPGRATFDTKLDLAVNPIGFLARSLHLWNPQATSGELQNQAYGYLFPMGPFFALGQLLHLPVWITQRLWCALLLGTAFLGVLLLGRALRIGTESTRHVAALAYAVAPRVLTEIGPLSSESLPAVLLPWTLLPLVRADRGLTTPRRAAGLSALAVLCMGGVNAAMVLMALVLPGLWLLTRRFTAEHLRLIGWWCAGIVACVLWWLVPLFLLGRYSLPFLSYIESSTDTTAVASLFQAVRGTNQWVAYVVQGVPWWPSGWMLIDNPALMVATMLVAALGLAGLARPNLPERGFLVLAMVVGLLLLTVGYVGTLDSPLSSAARELLDGPLAPFRNIHKFEPVLRLPIVLGLAHGAPLLWEWLRRPITKAPTPTWMGALPALLLVGVVAAPAWLLDLRPGPGWTQIPAHWRQATTWLADQDRNARTLVVPGSGFGHYTWGRTVDEPIQPLAEAPWALRNQIPLGSEGNTRMMDAVEEALASGAGSPGLAAYLARAGYRYVLLRNDIDRLRTGAPPISVLRQALTRSPGFTRAITFGPKVTPADETSRSPVDYGTEPVPSIEVYEVGGAAPLARTVLTSDVATVSGGPESLLPLLDQGLIERDRPAVLAGERTGVATGPRLVTDGLRRRERNIGRVRDNLSQTLTATEAPRQDRPSLDILPYSDEAHQTVATYAGIRSVTASTSASFADAFGGSEPSYLPFAAIDGDRSTSWHSSSFYSSVGQWLQVDLDTPREVDEINLEFVDDLRVGWTVARVRITTDSGSVERDVPPEPGPHAYDVVPGLTTKVRVTPIALEAGRTDGNVGIRELTIPDAPATRALRVPDDVESTGELPAFGFTRGYQSRPACLAVDGATRCDPNLARVGEEPHGVDRLFRTPAPSTYTLNMTAVARPGGVLPASPPHVTVDASSWLGGDPAVAALAAVDGDPATAWVSDIGDGQPALRLKWIGQRELNQIRLRAADTPVASTPSIVELRTPTETRLVRLDTAGQAVFPPLVTDQVEIAISGINTRSLDLRGDGSQAPAGIAEVELPGLAGLLKPVPAQTPFALPCGKGPAVELDGRRLQTALSGTLADVIARRPLAVTVCGLYGEEGIPLNAGEHHLRTEPSDHFVIQDATLRPSGWTAGTVHERPSHVERWHTTDRAVRVEAGEEALLVVPENANSGWVATLDGKRLTPTRVDGWQQAWTVPAGAGGLVRLRFEPDGAYRLGLAAGGVAALAVVILALLPARPRPDRHRRPPGRRYEYVLSAALVVLAVLLGGVLPVALVVACLIVRQLRPQVLPAVAFGGAAAAMVVAAAGRLLGHGQGWAHNAWAQGAMLVAVAAVIAAAIRVPGGASMDDDPSDSGVATGVTDR
ncbi:alpha-(1-_3)-arabinofuranosyltransferase [Phytohabitans rumicis]|uniref:Coagulation factor 5/8 type n=1 Tax=Phytohabitans rumicis TaxID=1076125 RepID=A0A6V8L8M9_9ACTN|nr:alpha-(1->3)-arabinofuranosyltransferase [Phytohabitans rumicis]GFJ92644.1 coagulation factor 5/8 type [Phytohabitans rumicis]